MQSEVQFGLDFETQLLMPTTSVFVVDSRLSIDSIYPKKAPVSGKYNFTLNLGGTFGSNIDKLICIIRNLAT
jgi:hypothetical protein